MKEDCCKPHQNWVAVQDMKGSGDRLAGIKQSKLYSNLHNMYLKGIKDVVIIETVNRCLKILLLSIEISV